MASPRNRGTSALRAAPGRVLVSPHDMPLTRGKPKVLAEQLLGEEHPPSVETARGLTFEVMRAYWASLAPGVLPRTAPLRSLETFGLELAPPPLPARDRLAELGESLGHRSPLAAGFEVGRLYMALLPKAYRSKHGIYFTPPALADRLLDLAVASGVDLATARVLDPACGGGAFLAPVAHAKAEALADQPASEALDRICSSVRGLEIDPFSAWMSQVFLEAVLLPLSQEAGRDLPVLVDVCDALQVGEIGGRAARSAKGRRPTTWSSAILPTGGSSSPPASGSDSSGASSATRTSTACSPIWRYVSRARRLGSPSSPPRASSPDSTSGIYGSFSRSWPHPNVSNSSPIGTGSSTTCCRRPCSPSIAAGTAQEKVALGT